MDLSQHNIIVDPVTLKIKAIIDFEYSSFWPMQFELPVHTRLGPSVAREGESDDADELLKFLTNKPADCVYSPGPDQHMQ
ncbi:hypothetical protein BGAL_0471g00080 [Botrytis galanthina]|uniref:Protein kinase domain-containing protein n=1 Tax=Botrytis galanthina TaxID=278940 RepID=A0A4S8QLE2_9HELO|nr:hypothetical protein BGAL_0471g00080 [Botrytis galanthina]